MGFVDGIAHTPHLDQLAQQGVHFPQAFSIHGQCAPSRCAFATGLSPHECNAMVNTGFHGHTGHLTKNNRTFFQEFQDAGYTTAHFGKSHLGSPLCMMGFDVGECIDGHFPKGKEPEYRIRVREEMDARGDGSYAYAEAAWPQTSTHYKYLKQGLEWLDHWAPGEKPLLFMYDTNLPHPPFYWEEQWQDRFRPEDMVLPRSYYEETMEGKPEFLREHAKAGPHKLESEDKLREEMAQYYTLIAAVDKACGQIIDVFKEKGIWDNTIVLFLSDHGDMMGGHGMTRKGTMPYEELYNVPCIMKLPQGMQAQRSVVDEVIVSTDIPAALLQLAGVDAPAPFNNSPVVEALNREAPTGEERVFFEHYAAWWGIHPFYGVRTNSMKYVRYYGKEQTEEMYDLASDPDELHNVAFDPDYARHKAELSSWADQWWESTGGQPAEFYESQAFKDNLNA